MKVERKTKEEKMRFFSGGDCDWCLVLQVSIYSTSQHRHDYPRLFVPFFGVCASIMEVML